MPRRRFFKLPEEKRTRILDIAAEEFAVHGFEGASINRIIENTGMSKGSLYYYFNDKEDLYSVVVELAFNRMAGQMAELSGGFSDMKTPEDFFQQIELFSKKMKEYFKENSRDGELLKGLARAADNTFQLEKLLEMRGSNINFIVNLLRVGQKIGAVRTDISAELLAGVLDSQDCALDRWLAERLDITTTEGLDEWENAALDLMMRIILPPDLLAARYGDDPKK